MTRRVGTTKQAAEHFGFVDNRGLPNVRAFMAWAKAHSITPEHGEKHHLWWNFKEIEQCLDRNHEIKSSEPDYHQIFRENFYGEGKSGLPHHPHP